MARGPIFGKPLKPTESHCCALVEIATKPRWGRSSGASTCSANRMSTRIPTDVVSPVSQIDWTTCPADKSGGLYGQCGERFAL